MDTPRIRTLATVLGVIAGAAGMYMLGPIPTEDPPPVVRGVSQGSGPTVNVLFLMWDTARADRMSLYGHTRNTTPYLEGFASESLVFEGAYAPSFWTVPSHASLFTGAPVSDHRTNAHQTWLPNEYVTLAEHLGSHGYETWMFTANPNLSPRTNLIQGFETVHSPRQVRWESQAIALTQAKLIASDMSTERSPSWPGKKNRASKEVGPLMGDALLDWLDARDSQRPFFAFINYMEVHGPRLPSMESRQALLDPETLALGLETSAGFRNISDANHTRQHYTTAQKEAMLGVYDAAILDLDRLTGDLLEALRERGVLDNTLIVLTSDHGDAFGEHDLFGHNYSLYNELIHVPLLLRLPQGAHAARVDHPVSNRAIFSTLTQLLNLPGPPIPSPLPSLLAAPNHPVVYAEFTASHGSKRGLPLTREDGSVIELRRRYLAQMTPAWKFIRSSDGNHELYDRTQDVGDQRNLAESEPERLKSLLEQAEIWREEHTRSTGKRLSSKERAMKKRAGADVPLEALEALGYME